MEQYQWLTDLPALVAIGILGMMTHFFKQKVKGETLTEIKFYFRDNFKSTLVALISTVVSTVGIYLTMGTGQPIDIITVFQTGYTFDNILNKWEKPTSA